VIFVIK